MDALRSDSEASAVFVACLASSNATVVLAVGDALVVVSAGTGGQLEVARVPFLGVRAVAAGRRSDRLVAAADFQVWRLEQVRVDGPEEGRERVFTPRTASVTGDVGIVDLRLDADDEAVFVAGGPGCLARTSTRRSLRPVGLGADGTGELAATPVRPTGVELDERGRPRWLTGTEPAGRGVVLDLATGARSGGRSEVLSCPRRIGESLWVLGSESGILRLDGELLRPVADPGERLRGMARLGDAVVVGCSGSRSSARGPAAGLLLVDAASGSPRGELRVDVAGEVVDLAVLPRTRSLRILGLGAIEELGAGSERRSHRRSRGPSGSPETGEAARRVVAGPPSSPPDEAVIRNRRGAAALERGELATAVAELGRAVELEPALPSARHNLAQALWNAGRSEALGQWEEALRLRPVYPRARAAYGRALGQAGRTAEGLDHLRTALGQAPELGSSHHDLAVVLQLAGRLAEAEAAYGTAMRLDPALVPTARRNLGELERHRGDRARAREHFAAALKHDPACAEAHVSLGTELLAAGDLEAGWQHLLWRPSRRFHRAGGLPPDRAPRPLPEDLTGRTVLLEGEMGLGDELFHLRWARPLVERGARLVLRCGAKLVPTLERLPWLAEVVASDSPAPDHDLEWRLGDLPLVASAAAGPMPRPVPLSVDPRRLAEAEARSESWGPGPIVAVSWWAGTPPAVRRGVDAAFRAVPLADLAAALRDLPGTVVSVQRRAAPADLVRLEELLGRPIVDAGPLNDDLEAFLAVLLLADEVVGPSSTTFHLLAGLGRRGRVLVPWPAEWLFPEEGPDSPWFPSFTLYREDRASGWDGALLRLARDLRERLGERDRGP